MNPIPFTWCLGGAGTALLLGALAGWTACDWKRDSADLKAVKASAEQVRKAADRIDQNATKYEQEKPDAQNRSDTRETTIREIYRDRPVPADCAVPDGVGRVLDDAIRDANARAAGKPAAGLPAASGPSGPAR